MGIVYKATNKIDGTSYIGATRQPLSKRRSEHETKRNGRWHAIVWAIREYGKDNFEWSVICEVPNDQLRDAEMQAIAEARSRGERLYNMSDGPGSMGIVVSAETREKIAASKRGKPRSAETCAKISATKCGVPLIRFEGKSYAEWAAELGTTPIAVLRRIHHHGTPYRLRRKLRKAS